MSARLRLIDFLLGQLTTLYECYTEHECSECYSRRINDIEPADYCEHCDNTGLEPSSNTDMEN